MSASSSKKPQPPPLHLNLQVGTSAAAAANDDSAASPGSESSSHHSPSAPRRTTNAAGEIGSGHSNHNPACASCKYQRRKCSRDCPLAPYFPANQQHRFLKTHRLFGVSNITKTLRRVEPKYAADAMRSIIYEADARAADPVGGCVGIIQELRRQIHDTETELQFVRQQIAICREQAAATDGGLSLSDPAAAAAILPAPSPVVAGQHQQEDMTAAVAAICAGQQLSIPVGDLRNDPSLHQRQLYDYLCYNNAADGDEAIDGDDGVMMQQYGFAGVVDSSVKEAGSLAVALGEQLGQHCQIQASPFVDAFNVNPQVLPPATVHHHGPAAAGDVLRPRQKKLGTPFLVEHDDVDVHMEEEQPATAGAPCHLELGFSCSSSSSFYNA